MIAIDTNLLAFGPREVMAEAVSLGLDLARFRADLDSVELAQEHERRVVEVESRGVFGVPTFFYRDQLYWGNDRLVLGGRPDVRMTDRRRA